MMRFKNVDPLFHTPSKTNPLGLVRHFIGGVSVDTRYIQIFTSFLRLTMTVRTESAQLTIESPKTNCGRCSCIILYSSENCILCDAALEILYSVISDFGLPHSVIRKVDVINDEDVLVGILSVDDVLEILANEFTELVSIVNKERHNEESARIQR